MGLEFGQRKLAADSDVLLPRISILDQPRSYQSDRTTKSWPVFRKWPPQTHVSKLCECFLEGENTFF